MLTGVTVLAARFVGSGDVPARRTPGSSPPLSGIAKPDEGSVVFSSSFEIFSEGAVAGSRTWGRASFRHVVSSGDGSSAQLVAVATGGTGGIWFDVPVTGGASYRQAVDLEIVELAPGARIEMILEWFNADSDLIGYRLTRVPAVRGTRAQQQDAQAPPAASTARFVVNAAGGGTYVMDNARLYELSGAGPGR